MAKHRVSTKDRFVPPIMQAFRSAFRERDAGKAYDIKNGAGERVIPGRRSSPRNAVSEALLREELALDLSSLLNTINLASAEDLAPFDRVRKSILNFGVADLTAIAAESHSAASIAGDLSEFLSIYEARLVPDSIKVGNPTGTADASGVVRFHVSAEMYSTPVDIAVQFVADIDTDTGKMHVSRL